MVRWELVRSLAHNTNEPPPREPRPLPEFIILPIDGAIQQPSCSEYERYTIPPFKWKVPKYMTFISYDKDNKLIIIEYTDGRRSSRTLADVFGVVIANVKEVYLKWEVGEPELLNIVDIKVEKVKRTTYWSLVFERTYCLPF